LGYVQTPMLGQRPWTRAECARLLEEVGDALPLDSARGDQAGIIYRSLKDEFLPEEEGSSRSARPFLRLDSIYTRVTEVSGPPLTDDYNFGRTIVNDFGRPFQRGTNVYSGASGYGTAGPFAFYIKAEYQYAPSAPGFSAAVRQAIADQESVPVAPDKPFAEVNRLDIVEGYLSAAYKGMQFSFGKQALSWGPTETGSLIWSTNSEPVNMFRISNLQPFSLPGIFHFLGPVQTEFFVGQLHGQQYILTANGIVGPSSFNPQPFIHGQKLSFKPTPNLEFGFSRTVIFSGVGHPFTFGSFARSFFNVSSGAALDVRTDAGDRRSGFDFSYRLPHLRDWLTLYTDSFCEDDVSPLAAPHRCAWSPGLYLAKFPAIPKLDFRAEGVYTNVPGFQAIGVNYQNVIYRSGYTNDGDLIGNWIGRQGIGAQIWSTYWLTPQTKIQAGYRRQRVDPDFLKGGKLDDFSITTDLMLRPDLALSGTAQYENWNFPLLAATTKSNLSLSMMLTFRPKWGSLR
jgi:hypothetical protein